MEGKCGLCLRETKLKNSHLIPAGFYRLLRSDSKNPNPVRISGGTANTTSEQIRGHFLCGECEQRFNKLGENYVLNNCLRQNEGFKIEEKIKPLPRLQFEDGTYAVKLGKEEEEFANYCSYFAASVFWRASARKWKANGKYDKLINLGPYEEDFRQYLIGNTKFPQKSILFLQVTDNKELGNVVMTPATGRKEGMFRHKFYVPGLLFNLFVGNLRPKEGGLGGIAPKINSLFYGSAFNDEWFVQSAEEVLKAEWAGKLGKER